MDKAPTTFGPVSFRVDSRLENGAVTLKAESLPRPVGKWRVRLPDPPGYCISGVRIGDEDRHRYADGRVDLTGRKGNVVVRFAVEQK